MVSITFETTNAIFEDNPHEIARILEQLSRMANFWHEGQKYVSKMYDYNGNYIGMYLVDLT